MTVYQEVARTLESEIRSGLSNGDFLPSEAALAGRVSINRHTVRRAIDELVNAGLVLRQHGKGTMVVNNRIEYSIGARGRFTETLEEQGLHPSCQVISVQTMRVDSKLAARMRVAPDADVTRIDTLRCVDDQPICVISHYLLDALLPGIGEGFKSGSLHAFIESHYGLRIQRRQCLVGASLPTASEARLLHCPRQLPLVVVKSNNTLWGENAIVEYSVSRSRSDVFEMKIESAR